MYEASIVNKILIQVLEPKACKSEVQIGLVSSRSTDMKAITFYITHYEELLSKYAD